MGNKQRRDWTPVLIALIGGFFTLLAAFITLFNPIVTRLADRMFSDATPAAVVAAQLTATAASGVVSQTTPSVLGATSALTPIAPTDTQVPKPTRARDMLSPYIQAETPTASSAGSVLFTDDFSSGCNYLTEQETDTFAFKCEDGAYTMLNKTSMKNSSGYQAVYDDFVFEADGHLLTDSEDSAYGLIFRRQDNPRAYYAFVVTTEGAYEVFVCKDDDCQDLIPATVSPSVSTHSASPNHFKIVAQGDELAFYLNDYFLDKVGDTTSSQGNVGFFLGSRQPNVKVAFDNVRISR